MTLPDFAVRASVLALPLLNTIAHAHPGHSHFGSADEEPGLFFLIWIGVILAMSAYGGWRLFRALTNKNHVPTNDK